MKNLALEIKQDKSLWERMNIEDVGEVLLVEESYYDGIVEDVSHLQQEVEKESGTIDLTNESLRFITSHADNGKLIH